MDFRSDARKLAPSINVFKSNIRQKLDRGFSSILPASSRDTKPGTRRKVDTNMVPSNLAVVDRMRSNTVHQVPRGKATTKPQRRNSIGSSPSESEPVGLERTVLKHGNPKVSAALYAFEATICSNLEHGFDTILPATCSKSSRQLQVSSDQTTRSPRGGNLKSNPTFGSFPSPGEAEYYGYGDQSTVATDKRKHSMVPRYATDSLSQSLHAGANTSTGSRGVARRRNSLSNARPAEEDRDSNVDAQPEKSLVSTRTADPLSRPSHKPVDSVLGSRRVARCRNSHDSGTPTGNQAGLSGAHPSRLASKKYPMVPRAVDSLVSLSRSVHSVPEPAARPRSIVCRRNSLNSTSPVGEALEDFCYFSDFDFDAPDFEPALSLASPTTLSRTGAKKSAGRIATRRYRLSCPAVVKHRASSTRDESSQATEGTADLTASSQHSSDTQNTNATSPRRVDVERVPIGERRLVPRPNLQ